MLLHYLASPPSSKDDTAQEDTQKTPFLSDQNACRMTPYQKYLEVLQSLTSISEAERKTLLGATKHLEKEFARQAFKQSRVEKDKEIATNLLQATIVDLEKHKAKLQEANELLQMQKQTIEENLQKLKHSYGELEQFSYIASHDLKSPLRTIASFSQLIKRRYYNKLDEEANEFLDFIASGVQQMNDVIQHSLEYARVGNDVDSRENVSLTRVLNLVLANLKQEIIETGAVLQYPENLPTVLGHKTSLVQLFQNLIGNAIKFRQKDQIPVISIDFVATETDFWQFYIKDNGIGVEAAYQEQIFMPFKKIHEQGEEGQGIGLAICKKIVQKYGGQIYLSSERGYGTTFFVTLPKGKAQL